MKKIIALGLLLLINVYANAVDWHYIGSMDDKKYYIDADNIKKITYNDKEVISGWSKIELSKNRKDHMYGKDYVRVMANKFMVNCKDSTIVNVTAVSIYDDKGNWLRSEKVPDNEIVFEDIVPGTAQEQIRDTVCP